MRSKEEWKKSDKKTFKDKEGKKSYITREDNDMDSLGDSENEVINLSLMAKNFIVLHLPLPKRNNKLAASLEC